MKVVAKALAFCLCLAFAQSRMHHLVINRDRRTFFPISTFGFITGEFFTIINVTKVLIDLLICVGGSLSVNVSGFHVLDNPEWDEESGQEPQSTHVQVLDPVDLTLGFSIAKTTNDALNPYAETSEAS
jgi:hypothetical protein